MLYITSSQKEAEQEKHLSYNANFSVCKQPVNKTILRKWLTVLISLSIKSKYRQGCHYCVSKKSGNFAKWLMYPLLQATGLPRHRRSQLGGGSFPVFVWSHRNFLQNTVKIFEFNGACWWFWDGCEKIYWF